LDKSLVEGDDTV